MEIYLCSWFWRLDFENNLCAPSPPQWLWGSVLCQLYDSTCTQTSIQTWLWICLFTGDYCFVLSLSTVNCPSCREGLTQSKAYTQQKGWPAHKPKAIPPAWTWATEGFSCPKRHLFLGMMPSGIWSRDSVIASPVLRPNADHNFIFGCLVSRACQLQIWRHFNPLKCVDQFLGDWVEDLWFCF